MSSAHRDQKKPVRRLICSCCGAHTAGRQWHNRDTGYGLCNNCIDYVATRTEDMDACYGVLGVHYGLELTTPAGPGHPLGHPLQKS